MVRGRFRVDGRCLSSAAAGRPRDRLRDVAQGEMEVTRTQQETLADWGGASLPGRWVSCRQAVRPGVEWLATGPRRD